MSAAPANVKSGNGAWFGLGMSVDSRLVIGGIQCLTARMQRFEGPESCMIQVLCGRVGPGLGGGGDLTLFLAAFVDKPADFSRVAPNNGFSLSLTVGEGSLGELKTAVTAARRAVRGLSSPELQKILRDGIKNAGDFNELRERLGQLMDVRDYSGSVSKSRPSLFMLPLASVGFEASFSYQFYQHVRLLG